METLLTLTQQILNGLLTGTAYVLIALGLTIIFGIYRVINMAHGIFYMCGGFCCYVFATLLGLNTYLSMLLSMIVTGGVAAAVERIVFRPLQGSPDWVFLVVGIGLYFTLENFGWIVEGPLPLHVHAYATQVTLRTAGLYFNLQKLVMAGVCLLLLMFLYYILRRTDVGRAMRAVSVDPEAAKLMGIHPGKVSMVVFYLGGAFAAAAGSLVGSLSSINPTMGFSPQLMAFIVVVFGGMGSILGTVIAGLFVGILQNVIAWAITPRYSYAFTMLLLLIIFIIRPKGLFGEKS